MMMGLVFHSVCWGITKLSTLAVSLTHPPTRILWSLLHLMVFIRPGKVNLQFIVSFYKKYPGGRSFFTIHYHFFETKLLKVIQKFVRVRKSVKNWSKIIIMGGSVWSDAGGDDKLQINFAWPYNTS